MTLKELIAASAVYADADGDYVEDILILVNGKPADDINFGLIAETGQTTLNILSYETH